MRDDVLTYQGVRYIVSEWLTLAAYSAKYNVPLQTIHTRILRGNLAPADVLELPHWGLKLLRDVPPAPIRRGPRRTP